MRLWAMKMTNKTNEMGRPSGLRKGCWTEEEDRLLKTYVEKYGEGNWKHIPTKAAELNRCRKSCRLRWLNYLRPNIKRGDFAVDEDDLIIRLHKLLGNRWSLIGGRIPGRTANDIKNYWNSYLSKKIASESNNATRLETHYRDNSVMNSEPSEGDFRPSSDDIKTEGKGEEEKKEEEVEDTALFWRSLLLEGVLKETRRLTVENKEKKVQEDDFFQGLGDLVQDMEMLGGGSNCEVGVSHQCVWGRERKS